MARRLARCVFFDESRYGFGLLVQNVVGSVWNRLDRDVPASKLAQSGRQRRDQFLNPVIASYEGDRCADRISMP